MKRIDPASPAKGFFGVIGFWLAVASAGFAQTSLVPAVSVLATQPVATMAQPGAFTLFRSGNTNVALNVWYDLGGTASNGADYAAIAPHLVEIPAGVTSNTVAIAPLTNPPAGIVETVVLTLTNSPLMTPVNYQIGWPSVATVYILPPDVSNLPPVVKFDTANGNPTNGQVFYAPADIYLDADANDLDGSVTNVEFFANGADLGRGVVATTVVIEPPGTVAYVVYDFRWQNVPTNDYSLTAVATDNGGLSTTSAPVHITVQLPPTNSFPPVVRITSPPNGATFFAPVNIPLHAYARAFDWRGNVFFDEVTNLEFYADGRDLGPAKHVVFGPPPPPPGGAMPNWVGLLPYNFFLLWSNAPVGPHRLTAVAEDQLGMATTSAPVNINVLPSPPPPTNCPPVVNIVATDPVAIEGTNDWVWPGETNSPPTWSAWPPRTICWFTNYGPKTATFAVRRFGDISNNLTVPYAIGGTATNGVDYVALPGNVTIPAGARRADITIVPLDDGPPDITSTVVLKLIPDATGTNYVLGFPRAAGALILDSPSSRLATGILPGPAFHLAAAGPNGAWFHVESSTDLVHWTPLCTNQVVNGQIDFVDPNTATSPVRYYRAVPDSGPPQ